MNAELAQLAVDFHFEIREVENQGPEAFRDRALKRRSSSVGRAADL
jgi:hypothetical protein